MTRFAGCRLTAVVVATWGVGGAAVADEPAASSPTTVEALQAQAARAVDFFEQDSAAMARAKATGQAHCSSDGLSCTGPYSLVIQHTLATAGGQVRLRMEQAVIDAIQAAGGCSLYSNQFLNVVPDGDGGEETIQRLLHLSYIRDDFVALRLAQGSSGYCKLSYVRVFYTN